MRAHHPAPASRGPFSRLVDVRRLPEGGQPSAIEATPDECTALASHLDLASVASLSGRFELRRRAGSRVEVKGSVAAVVDQVCVVTLEPFTSRVAQSVDLVFAPAVIPEAEPGRAAGRRKQRAADDRDLHKYQAPIVSAPVPGNDDQVDPPDPLVNDTIDLGAVAVEFIALALDPYPRKPGVAFDDVVTGTDSAEVSPFAALDRLKAGS